ncbi:hypothetical protein C8R47DRAFT_155895 [Mycena vitilis]|nr:hypothetical protein C8R47DRAFT_155895 [Mycena vitilis]
MHRQIGCQPNRLVQQRPRQGISEVGFLSLSHRYLCWALRYARPCPGNPSRFCQMSAPETVNTFPAAIQQVNRVSALKVLALCSSPHAQPDSTRTVSTVPPGPWRHAAELDYIGPNHPSVAMWSDYSIITYLVHTAITVPPRSDSRSDPWVVVSTNDSGNATLPRGYRVPVLWLMKVQWESLKLLLTVARPLWDTIKWDILHIARLTNQFLAKARSEPRMKRQWRDAMFDRTLTRFFNGWMGCGEVFIWDFYREFRDEEYKDDVLARRWAQKVPKGIQGLLALVVRNGQRYRNDCGIFEPEGV